MWYMDCGSALISYSHSLILYLGEKDNLYFVPTIAFAACPVKSLVKNLP